MSMKPGASTNPFASMTYSSCRGVNWPTLTMRSPLMRTLADFSGPPVPSATCAFTMTALRGPEGADAGLSWGCASGAHTNNRLATGQGRQDMIPALGVCPPHDIVQSAVMGGRRNNVIGRSQVSFHIEPLLLLRQIQIGERALECLGRPRNRLGERGMRMNRESDVGGVAAGFHCQRDLADQLTGVTAHDAAAQHAVIVRIEQQLGKTLLATERE